MCGVCASTAARVACSSRRASSSALCDWSSAWATPGVAPTGAVGAVTMAVHAGAGALAVLVGAAHREEIKPDTFRDTLRRINKAVQSVSIFALSSGFYCSGHSEQCFSVAKGIATVLVIGGVVGYGVFGQQAEVSVQCD